MTAVTAVLKQAFMLPNGCVWGFIHNDVLGRFKDGKGVVTNLVTKFHEATLIETKSGNFYRVEWDSEFEKDHLYEHYLLKGS